MKSPSLVVPFVLLLCGAVGYAQPGRKSSASVETAAAAAALSAADLAAIRAASARSSEFGNNKDWSSWSHTYTDDAVVMPPNGPAVSGRAEIENWGRTFPPHREFRVEPVEIEGRGDLAMVRGRYSFILMLPGQPEQLDSGKYMEIWRRQPDGTWKIWRDILNSDLPPAPAIATSAPDPWLGTWELNVAKTRINPGPAPRSETRTYRATADGEMATYDLVESDGKRLYQESVYKLDRQHVPLLGSPHGDTQALWRTGPRSLAGEIKRDGQVLGTAIREVSEDGQTLTVEFKGRNQQGQPIIEEVWLFDRKNTGTGAAR
jgi:ketosteroid isomerase-like protein